MLQSCSFHQARACFKAAVRESKESPGCTPYAAPPASECWRQAVETMARWPLDDPGPVKARLLDGCVTRRRPREAGALAEEPLGKPKFASCFSLLVADCLNLNDDARPAD